jgi:hypothetical protein
MLTIEWQRHTARSWLPQTPIAERLTSRNQEDTVWRSSEPLHRIADAFREHVAAEARLPKQ